MSMSVRRRRFAIPVLLAILTALPLYGQEWREVAPLPFPRYDVAAVELDGRIYAIGGRDSDRVLRAVHRYEPGRDRWTEIAAMNEARSEAAAVVLNGRIYVIGGVDDRDKAMDDVEVYDPSEGRWDDVEELEVARRGHQAVVLDGRIYVAGGVNAGGALVREVEVYDPDADVWSVSEEWILTNPRVAFALVAIDGEVYVLGGLGGSIFEPVQNSEVFKPGRGPDVFMPPALFRSRGYLAASVAGESAYLMGGMDRRGVLADVVRFTPSAEILPDRWTDGPPMRQARKSFAAVSINGRLYAIGGQDDRERTLASVESMVTNTRVETPDETPERFVTLEQNHPNPFTHSTTVLLVVGNDRPARVAVDIYDLAGRRIRSLVDGTVDPGRHELEWDGRSDDGRLAGSGVYFCVLKRDGRRVSRTITLIR